MTQNIYDTGTFFAAYSRLPRSVDGLDGAPEWPALQALLPDLNGRTVLDLGCGFGWFCRWARRAGAASVVGVDASARMLARAKAETDDPAIGYTRADLEQFAPRPATFDLAYSSLAFHYIADLQRLLARVHAALVPGGTLVFSVEHPICTAPTDPARTIDAGHATWPVNQYLDEGPRMTNWLAPGVIKQHRTIATYVTLVLRTGFTLSHVDEWGLSEAQVGAHPEWADERHRPSFLLVRCGR